MRSRFARIRAEDAGFSLVEVLISLVIIGICFAGLLGGMGTSIVASSIHRAQADGHALIVSAAESLKDDARNPFSCDVSTYDVTSGVVPPSGWATSDVTLLAGSVEHGYWDGSSFASEPICGAGTDLQRITLQVTSPDGRATEELTVFKRRA